jgi:tetraacyldisaccharide 4'-kinase
MDEPFFLDVICGRKRGLTAGVLRAVCGAASVGYGAAVGVRNLAYDRRWLSIHAVETPVISVGNLTAGGTGKTPFVALLAERLQQLGRRPGIVSRGYRSLDKHTNDERLVLEQLAPGVPQVLNRDRVAGAWTAFRDHGCDVVVLDDGFQHRRLHRDLDIVLIDATRPWGFGRLLPRGLLREPMSSLRRADLVVVTRCDQVSAGELSDIRHELKRWRGVEGCVEMRFSPRRLRNAQCETRPLAELTGRTCLPFCGIGNPDAFRRTLGALGVDAAPVVFPDHHPYTRDDVEHLSKQADAVRATLLVTTLKDLVKIPRVEVDGKPLWAIDIAAEIVSHGELLEQALRSVRQRLNQAA